MQGDVEEDEMIPDRDEDIRPRFHKSKRGVKAEGENMNTGETGGEEDEEEDEDDLDDDSSLSDWNLSE